MKKPERGDFIVDTLIKVAEDSDFEELILPSLEPTKVYTEKAGVEILRQIYTFKDKGERDVCLRPEGTATCQLLADSFWKTTKDVKIFYVEKCWRYEKPQAGRYREFLQFGVEWLNPRSLSTARSKLIALAQIMIMYWVKNWAVNVNVKRGLAYYIEDGFEFSCPDLGAQKQICGGGSYKQGCGFAIGIDRLQLAYEIQQKNIPGELMNVVEL